MRPITPSGPIASDVRLPGSKSITNRALVAAALAEGTSRLVGPLRADDTEAMVDALQRLGVSVGWRDDDLEIEGALGRFPAEEAVIDARGSGTTARFLTAAATLASGTITIDGNSRLRRRPVGDLARALNLLGAAVEVAGHEDSFPVAVHGPALSGGAATLEAGRSSQFASAILLTAPCAETDTILELTGSVISKPYIDQTIEVMRAFGATVEWEGPTTLAVASGGYQAQTYQVEGDASAAVYPLVAATLCGGTVTVGPIGNDSVQADLALLPVLESMGADVEQSAGRIELVGHPARLAGVTVDMNDAPDAVLALAVVGVFAKGRTAISNVGNLRIKESDRIAALEAELGKLGADVEAGEDHLSVSGNDLRPASIDAHGDHRIAMALALAGLRIPGVEIAEPQVVAKTWPGFFEMLDELQTPLVVTIDGPGGVGKSTVSRLLAARFGFGHLETGAMYRAATLAVLEAGLEPGDSEQVAALVEALDMDVTADSILLGGRDVIALVRSDEVGAAVSEVSALPAVRRALVGWQRQWVAKHPQGAVVEGRDIGTVVFPDSPAKIYLTALPEIRATRRVKDMGLADEEIPRIAAELARRDHFDSTRKMSPLRPADDASLVDTSELTAMEVVDLVAQLVIRRGS